MAHTKKKKTATRRKPLSWYPTDAERAQVAAAADLAELSMSEFQRRCILSAGKPIIRNFSPSEDHVARLAASQSLCRLADAVEGRPDALDLTLALLRIERLLADTTYED